MIIVHNQKFYDLDKCRAVYQTPSKAKGQMGEYLFHESTKAWHLEGDSFVVLYFNEGKHCSGFFGKVKDNIPATYNTPYTKEFPNGETIFYRLCDLMPKNEARKIIEECWENQPGGDVTK